MTYTSLSLQKKHSGPSNADEALKLRERLGGPPSSNRLGLLLATRVCCLNLEVPEGWHACGPRLSSSRQCHCSGADTPRHAAVSLVRTAVFDKHAD